MRARSIAKVAAFLVAACLAQTICLAQTVIDADFSKGSFAALGWKAKGDWDVFQYPKEAANNPGPVARFAANKPDGSLTKTFKEVKNPKTLSLSLDYGWGWGDADQGSDAVSFMLLDAGGNGYVFEVHRCKATWAVQWAKVANGISCQGQDLGVRGNRREPRVRSRRRRLEPPDDHPRIRRSLDHRQQGLEQGRRRDGEVQRRHHELVQPVGPSGDPELR